MEDEGEEVYSQGPIWMTVVEEGEAEETHRIPSEFLLDPIYYGD